MLRRLTIPFLVGLLLVACNPTPPPATLTMSSRSPAPDEQNVALDAVVTATFSTDVRAASLDDNFTLTQGETPVEGSVTYDAATRTATFTPSEPLRNATTYTATVSGDVTSTRGVRLGSDSSWSFTTVSAGEVPAVLSVSIEGGDRSLLIGDVVDLEAVVEVVHGADSSVTWSSDDVDVATVNEDGVVTAVGAGDAVITATSAFDTTRSGSITVTVAQVPGVVSVTIDQDDSIIAVDGTVQLTASVVAVGGVDESVEWASSDTAVATVAPNGLVTGHAPGSATITVSSVAFPSVSDSVTVEVAPPLTFGPGAEYAHTTGDADVTLPLSIAAPALASAGYGAITYSVTAGSLPGPFVVDDGTGEPETYQIVVDPDTGTISGSTGYPGHYDGEVTATDELGQTATIPFHFDLDLKLELVNPTSELPQTTYTFTTATVTVVPGDRVRVSGVPNTEWLPQEMQDALEFELEFVGATPVQPDGAEETAFEVNTHQGAITRGDASSDATWVYDLLLTYGSNYTWVRVTLEGQDIP